MLTITGPGPLWASSEPKRHNTRWKPSAKPYAAFAHAVATRYKEEVDRYLIWNEPNQQGWLQPQWECNNKRRNCTAVSPHLYRALVRAAEPQVHAADPGSEVVMGGSRRSAASRSAPTRRSRRKRRSRQPPSR